MTIEELTQEMNRLCEKEYPTFADKRVAFARFRALAKRRETLRRREREEEELRELPIADSPGAGVR